MSETPEWQHLKAYGYAPGNYMNKCRTCGKVVEFVDKRAIACRPCAEARHAEVHPLAAAVPQQEAGEPVARVALIFAQQNGWDGADGAPKWLVELVQDVADALATPQVSPPQARVPLTVLESEMLAALQGVVRVADRATVEFDAARDAIEHAHLIGLETKE